MVWILLLAIVIVALIVTLLFVTSKLKALQKKHQEKTFWYESLLDAIPYPISVTDQNMNWTFVNKPVEDMFHKKRSEFIGQHCSNWGAKICKTDNCGIHCLKEGLLKTNFEQSGMEFQVYTSYLHNKSGKTVGHIEVVQDISELKNVSREQEIVVEKAEVICKSLIEQVEIASDTSRRLADGSNDQMAAIEELVATVNEISSKTKSNSENLEATTDKIKYARSEIQNSNGHMSELIKAMEKVDSTSKEVSNIITSIETIASQTNLLSLNASIEAARAGEAGRGFAVVADQIGQLAGQSAEAAKSTKELINTTIEAIENGNNITSETASSLELVVSSIEEIQDYAVAVTNAIAEQVISIEQTDKGLEQISEVIQENSTIANDSSDMSEAISEQVHSLENIVRSHN